MDDIYSSYSLNNLQNPVGGENYQESNSCPGSRFFTLLAFFGISGGAPRDNHKATGEEDGKHNNP